MLMLHKKPILLLFDLFSTYLSSHIGHASSKVMKRDVQERKEKIEIMKSVAIATIVTQAWFLLIFSIYFTRNLN